LNLQTLRYQHWQIFQIRTYIHLSTDIDISFRCGLTRIHLCTDIDISIAFELTDIKVPTLTYLQDADCIHWGTDIDISLANELTDISFIYCDCRHSHISSFIDYNWEKSWKNLRRTLYFYQNFDIFSLKMGFFGEKIQHFTVMFTWFSPVYDTHTHTHTQLGYWDCQHGHRCFLHYVL